MQSNQVLIQPKVPAGEENQVDGMLGAVAEKLGFVPDGLRLYSISPPLLESFLSNIGYFNSGDVLPPKLMAMIRYLVSTASECSFCIDFNESMLGSMGASLDTVRAARNDIELAPVEPREMPLLRLAVKAVTDPEQVSEADIAAARHEGWSDRHIFDAVVQAANNRAFSYVLKTFKVEHQGAFAA